MMTSPTGSLTSKGTSTRARILQAARDQLVHQGYEAFVVRELADELGMKLGNLQYYFKTREALIRAVIEIEAQQDVELISAQRQRHKDPLAALNATVRELLTRWRGSSSVLFSTLATLSLHNNAYRDLYKNIYRQFYAALQAAIQEVNPNLTVDEATLRVRLITALVDGSSVQSQLSNTDAFVERVIVQAEDIALAPAIGKSST